MTSPGTMKTIQKRIYTVVTSTTSTPTLPRVRSNSASASRNLYTANTQLSFFDSPPPPPPSSRPGNPHVLSTSRLPVKGDGSGSGEGQQHHTNTTGPQPPFSLALTSPQPNASPPHTPAGSSYAPGYPFFPYNALTNGHQVPFYNVRADADARHAPSKAKRTKYQLDVGAYGIAKRSRRTNTNSQHAKLWDHREEQSSSSDDLNLAVQVGEDAYFIRDNAMGVADGVGGWARTRHGHGEQCPASSDASPSALFARRLMNFCSAETEAAFASSPTTSPRSISPFTPPAVPIHTTPSTFTASTWPWSSEYEHESRSLAGDLEDSLEELEEGLDVLMILERAYESAIKAHVVPTSTPSRESSSASNPIPPSPLARDAASKVESTLRTAATPRSRPPNTDIHRPTQVSNLNPTPSNGLSGKTALLQGSSTALLAVLDHSHRPSLSHSTPSTVRSKSPTLKTSHPAPRSSSQSPAVEEDVDSGGAVLKIAHLGDCMGMLVRGEEIVWRSEEMWWSFNTPVQLGPLSPSTPLTHARTFTIPIQQDDILILASDGLSDNLWDEDVLDEVVRFRRSFLPSPSSKAATEKDNNRAKPSSPAGAGLLGRRTLAGMLSEALCSRARRVSERRPQVTSSATAVKVPGIDALGIDEFEVPFARRAREQGRSFRGGKVDDISVVIAVISPADISPKTEAQA